jgi:hypothetical protein
MSEEKRIGDVLDPQRYTEHVVRTAMLLERLAEDVRELKDNQKLVEAIRTAQGKTEREFDVFKVQTMGEIATNRETITKLSDGLQWLRRLLIAALLSGLIGVLWTVIKTGSGH